ncbi:MAG: helix-turn-helix domain-containing protein [Thalassobaculaceae bacterium]
MAKARRYRLLCPVARALDRIGDRWSLLILRDLHAGPARFSDLLSGLNGIATNMLTDRLEQLVGDGLVERRGEAYGVSVYALTTLGRGTETLIFDLAMFGGLFPPDDDLRPPGNLRTIVVPLRVALRRVVPKDLTATIAFIVDGEPFTIAIRDGTVDMWAGRPHAEPDRTVATAYEPLVALSEGEIGIDDFLSDHVLAETRDPAAADGFVQLFTAALEHLRASVPLSPP